MNLDASRSSSLPRNSPSSGSRTSSNGSQDQNTPRHRSRSESATRRAMSSHKHPHSSSLLSTQEQESPTSRPLAPARSVTDVTSSISPSQDIQRWEDLAASEPSLIDPRQHSINSPQESEMRTTPSSHSIHNINNTQKLENPSWTDSSSIHDDQNCKKKSSIRTSIKNMFTFKKRYVGHLADSSHLLGQHLLTSPALSPSLSHSDNLTIAQAYAAMSQLHHTPTSTHTHITTHDHLPTTNTISSKTNATQTSDIIPSVSSVNYNTGNAYPTKQIHDCGLMNHKNTPHNHSHLNPSLSHLNRPTIRVVHISSV